MADISVLLIQLRKLREELNNALPKLAIQNAENAKALVERKIREIGFGAKYSGNRLPAWFFLGKAKSKAGEAYIESVQKRDNKAAKKEDGKTVYASDSGMTWADLRKAEGLPVDHVDLGFTNKTWAGLTPQQPYFESGVIICKLGGNSQEVVDKLNWNRLRYGDFFAKVLGPKEIEILSHSVIAEIKIIITNSGFKP